MDIKEPRALLIGENSQGSSHLAKILEGRGCDCRFATSYQEACSLLDTQHFDLVLSPLRLRDRSIFPLASLLEGSSITLFYFQLVEDGCWWLPALRSGRKCFGTHALRPSEFVISLNEIIAELQVESRGSAENEPELVSTSVSNAQTSAAAVSRPRSSARPAAAPAVRAPSSEFAARRAIG
jgi:DNA-binding NtrC family response regulator